MVPASGCAAPLMAAETCWPLTTTVELVAVEKLTGPRSSGSRKTDCVLPALTGHGNVVPAACHGTYLVPQAPESCVPAGTVIEAVVSLAPVFLTVKATEPPYLTVDALGV